MTDHLEGHPSHWKLDNGIRRVRICRGVSQYDLEEETGISQRRLSSIEIGDISPTLADLRVLARAFGCTVPDLTECDSKPFAHRRSPRKKLGEKKGAVGSNSPGVI